jgi:hypothetical protein
MNKGNVKALAIGAAILIVILIVMQWSDTDTASDGRLLLPDLKTHINDISSLTVTRGGDENAIVISKAADGWLIASRDDYPADIGTLRELLLALADAKIVERKTSNPERYDQLGLRDPEIEDSKAVRLQLVGADREYDVIIGDAAQGGYRYVRVGDDPQTWLIDRNPSLPMTPGAWLLRNIVDIKSADIRSVTISHPDGEQIRINKESAEASDFDVADIPEGRELSYATVANGIAGVLNALALDDVRKAADVGTDPVTTTFETFDGARIIVNTEKSDDESWITVAASSIDEEIEAVAAINARVAGWQFRIPQYKANQLTRRWEDILKPETE